MTSQEADRLASEHRAKIREAQEARMLASEHRAQIQTRGDGDEVSALFYEALAKRLDAEAARNAPVTITITREQVDGVIDALRTLAASEREQSIAASKAYSDALYGGNEAEAERQYDNARSREANAARLNELESIIRKASE